MSTKNINIPKSLICIGGLPGVGKTTIGLKLQQNIPNSIHICPDRIWLKHIGKDPDHDVLTDADITPSHIKNVIEEIKNETHENLLKNRTTIVPSAFMLESMRTEYEDLAKHHTIPFHAFWLKADIETRLQRAQKRIRDHQKLQNEKSQKNQNASAISNDKIKNAKINGPINWPIIDAHKTPDEIYKTIWKLINV